MPAGFMTKAEYEHTVSKYTERVDPRKMAKLQGQLASVLVGTNFGRVLSIPIAALPGFEPSQVGTISGALLDACIPELGIIIEDKRFNSLGITRAPGQLGQRESYPDYIHQSGARLELKLLYRDNKSLPIKRPPTQKEPSARLTQKVTFNNIQPAKDCLLVIAYAFEEDPMNVGFAVPTIVDLRLFPVVECVLARDRRLYDKSNGGWFGHFDTPVVLSKRGKSHIQRGIAIDYRSYGRKEDEGKDLNEDTNFGKLKRIPYEPLQRFIKECQVPINPGLSLEAQRIISEMSE